MHVEDGSRVNSSVDLTGRVGVRNVETINKVLANHVQQPTGRNQWTGVTISDSDGENEKKPRIANAEWKLKSDHLPSFLKLSRRSQKQAVPNVQGQLGNSQQLDRVSKNGCLTNVYDKKGT